MEQNLLSSRRQTKLHLLLPITNIPSLGSSLPLRPKRMQNLNHSKSLTEIGANSAKQIVFFSQLESKHLKDNEKKVLSLKAPPVTAADRLKNRNVIQLLCLRTGSWITVFALIGLITLVIIVFKLSPSFQSSGIIIRLWYVLNFWYVLVVLLVYFDNEILELNASETLVYYLENKLNFLKNLAKIEDWMIDD